MDWAITINGKTRRDTFKFWDMVHLILDIWQCSEYINMRSCHRGWIDFTQTNLHKFMRINFIIIIIKNENCQNCYIPIIVTVDNKYNDNIIVICKHKYIAVKICEKKKKYDVYTYLWVCCHDLMTECVMLGATGCRRKLEPYLCRPNFSCSRWNKNINNNTSSYATDIYM